MSIVALIFGIVGLLSSCILVGIIPCSVGLALSIISLKNQKPHKDVAIIGLVTSAVGILIFVLMMVLVIQNVDMADRTENEISSTEIESVNNEYKNNSTAELKEEEIESEEVEQTSEEMSTENLPEAESTEETTETVETENSSEEVEESLEEKIETIFYGEIGLNEQYYMGKEVAFSLKCDDNYDEKVEEASTESNLCYGSIRIQFKEEQELSLNEYITVSGIIGEDHAATVLKDAVVVSRGQQAEENYNMEIESFKQSFLSAESVSYEELLRYPDTYKDQKLKIELDITDVESDGMIFNGTIMGNVPGTENQVAIYDYRENREPRIQEGDNLIVYGVGNGTITMKIKDGSGLFAKTLDEYEVPCIYVQYIDFR